MLMGKSVYHVDQKLGTNIDKGGYYNDLTQKVIMGDDSLDKNGIPILTHCNGKKVYMPTMIFQYGLGAFDLWLTTGEEIYKDKSVKCAKWALDNQNDDGSWDNFSYIYPDNPFSAMSQGECASLLLRIYHLTKDETLLSAAKRAIDFMLIDVKNGGLTQYSDNEMMLLEYTHLPVVLNGWIFAAWGLYDLSRELPTYKRDFIKTINTLEKVIPSFDSGFWSLYNSNGLICSPFYHKLQIAQLNAMYCITEVGIFDEYSKKWERYRSKRINRIRAFLLKAFQKITE